MPDKQIINVSVGAIMSVEIKTVLEFIKLVLFNLSGFIKFGGNTQIYVKPSTLIKYHLITLIHNNFIASAIHLISVKKRTIGACRPQRRSGFTFQAFLRTPTKRISTSIPHVVLNAKSFNITSKAR